VQFDLPIPELDRYYSRTGDDGRGDAGEDETAISDPSSPELQRKPSRAPNKLQKKYRTDVPRPRSSSMIMIDDNRNKYSDQSSRRHRSASPASSRHSNETIVLPDRFDRHGRKKPERGDDPLVDKIQDLLSGRGTMGKLLQRFTEDLLGGSGNGRRL